MEDRNPLSWHYPHINVTSFRVRKSFTSQRLSTTTETLPTNIDLLNTMDAYRIDVMFKASMDVGANENRPRTRDG